jgi:HK97 family phage portal protein
MSRSQPLDLQRAFDDEAPRNQGATYPSSSLTAGSQAWADLFGPAGALPAVTEQTALQISAIYACVSLISGVLAALPVRIYSRDGDGELDEQVGDDLWWLLNEEMTPRWSADNAWEFIASTQLLRGDGLAKIQRTPNGKVIGIEPLHFDRVEPIPTPDGRRLVYVIQPDPTIPNNRAGVEVLDQDDVLHFAGFHFNGIRGLSPLRSALRMAAPVALSAQEWQARFFANGARPDYVLASDNKIEPATIDKIRAQISERHSTPSGWHLPMILSGGLTPHNLTLPADEMALLPTRQFQIEELARVYGVPPFMIGHTDKVSAWGSGLEAMGKGFVRYCLNPRLSKYRGEMNRKLVRTGRKVIEFDPSELEAADWKSLLEGYRLLIGRAGEDQLMTVEEVRERLRLRRTPKHGNLKKGSGNAPDPSAQPPGV